MSLGFSGSQYCKVAPASVIGNGGIDAYTIGQWVYISSSSGSFNQVLSVVEDSNGYTGDHIWGIGTVFNLNVFAPGYNGGSTTSFARDTWAWIGIVRLSSAAARLVKVELDGTYTESALVEVDVSGRNDATHYWTAFDSDAGGASIGDGMVGPGCAYDGALSEAEIVAIAMMTVPHGRTPAAIWPRAPGSRTRDFSGNGVDWTETGTITDVGDPPRPYGMPAVQVPAIAAGAAPPAFDFSLLRTQRGAEPAIDDPVRPREFLFPAAPAAAPTFPLSVLRARRSASEPDTAAPLQPVPTFLFVPRRFPFEVLRQLSATEPADETRLPQRVHPVLLPAATAPGFKVELLRRPLLPEDVAEELRRRRDLPSSLFAPPADAPAFPFSVLRSRQVASEPAEAHRLRAPLGHWSLVPPAAAPPFSVVLLRRASHVHVDDFAELPRQRPEVDWLWPTPAPLPGVAVVTNGQWLVGGVPGVVGINPGDEVYFTFSGPAADAPKVRVFIPVC